MRVRRKVEPNFASTMNSKFELHKGMGSNLKILE